MIARPQDERNNHRVDVAFFANKYVNGRPHLTHVKNLSRSGLMVERIFEPDKMLGPIGLQFQLPGTDRIIACAGELIYQTIDGRCSGIRFTSIANEHREIIDAFIADQLS